MIELKKNMVIRNASIPTTKIMFMFILLTLHVGLNIDNNVYTK